MTAAREAALRGRSVLLLEARERLGGRTWSGRVARSRRSSTAAPGCTGTSPTPGPSSPVPACRVEVSGDAEMAGWYVGSERRSGSIEQRDEIARRGWDRFVDGVRDGVAGAARSDSRRSTRWRASTG